MAVGPELLKAAVLDEFPIISDAAEAFGMDRSHLTKILNHTNHLKGAVTVYFKLKKLRGQPRYKLDEILEGYV